MPYQDNEITIPYTPPELIIITIELSLLQELLAGGVAESNIFSPSDMIYGNIFIDHAKDAPGAPLGAGTTYRIMASESITGEGNWRTIWENQTTLTAPTVMTTDGTEDAGSSVIECGNTVPVVDDIIFFKNNTLSNSEWSNVTSRVIAGGSESITILEELSYVQDQGSYYTQGEHFVWTGRLDAINRLKVVAFNNLGTTNQNIVWRVILVCSNSVQGLSVGAGGLDTAYSWQMPVLDKDLNIPPGSPSRGDRYIVATGASGSWSGRDKMITWWDGVEWQFNAPSEGWSCWVRDENESYIYDGQNWEPQLNPSVVMTYDVDGKLLSVVKDVAGVSKSNVFNYTGDKIISITENVQGIVRTKTLTYSGDILTDISKWV